jgi:multicomponent K+:H+ antiporter subunit A
VTAASLAVVISAAPRVFTGEPVIVTWPWIPGVGLAVSLRLDGLALFFSVLILGIGLLVILYARYYLGPADPPGKFYARLALFTAAMLGVVLADNLVLLAVFWEITSLASFLLIGYWQHRADAREGARMALAVTGAGGLAMLAGVLLIGEAAGSYEISAIVGVADQVRGDPRYPAALILILVGAFTKSAQFPFHFWLPAAMAAPTPVSAYLHSATLVNAGIFLVARLYPVLGGTPLFTYVVTTVGLVTFVFGAYVAVFKHDLKGLLAYSTMSHLGLITFLLGLDSPLSNVAAVFHIGNHATFKASLFMAAGIIEHEVGTRDMRRMGNLGKQMPFVRNVFIVGALALAGIPILNGFWSKEFVLEAGLEGSPFWAYALMVFGAALTAFYTFRMVWLVFFGKERDPLHVHRAGSAMRVSLAILAGGTFITWLFFGGLNGLLSTTLPFHELERESLMTMITAILSAPMTWLVLLLIAISAGISWVRAKGYQLFGGGWLEPFVDTSFGFDSLNKLVVRSVSGIAENLRATQTGELNWNIFGIISGLLIVLVILWMGA